MKKGYWYIAAAALLFSSMEVALKLVAGQFHPLQMTFSRFLAGGLVLLPLALHALRVRGVRVSRRSLGIFALLGFVGIAVSMTLYQTSVGRINASVIGVLFSSNPIFVTLFAWLLLRESISKHQVAGLTLDIIGILVIINPLHLRLDPLGVVLVLSATLLFAIYSVYSKRQCAQYGSTVVTCFGFLFGAAEMMLFAALTHIPAVAAALAGAGLESFANIPFLQGYTLATMPVVLYVFIGVTGVGFACYFRAMEVTSAQQASLVFFFKPALAPVLAFLLLHEEIPGNMLVGILLILCGSMVSLLPGLRRVKEQHTTV